MKKDKSPVFRWLKGITVWAFVAFPLNAVALERYLAFPSTRAMGMSGAFVAQANDSSAMWYNIAGLGRPGAREFSIEQANTPSTNPDDDSEDVKFLSISFGGNGVGGGFAYYTPYKDISINHAALGTVDLDYESLMFGEGVKVGNAYWGFGLSIDEVLPHFSGSSSDSVTDMSLMLGFQYQAISNEHLTLNLGVSYRTGSDFDFYDYGSDWDVQDALDASVPDFPTRMSYGLNLEIPVPIGLLSLNYDQEDIGETGDDGPETAAMARTAYGIEFHFAVSSSIALSLRTGRSETAPEETGASPDIIISSTGFGLGFGQKHYLDFATESRSFKTPSGTETDAIEYTSMSYSYQF